VCVKSLCFYFWIKTPDLCDLYEQIVIFYYFDKRSTHVGMKNA
jgi:hypothetical protein